jgi:hypothetical protein
LLHFGLERIVAGVEKPKNASNPEQQREFNRQLLQLGRDLDMRYGVFDTQSALEAVRAFALDRRSQSLIDYMKGNVSLLNYTANPANASKLLQKLAKETKSKSDLLESKKVFQALMFNDKFDKAFVADYKKNQREHYQTLKEKYSNILSNQVDLSFVQPKMFDELSIMPSLVTELIFDLAVSNTKHSASADLSNSFKLAFERFYDFFQAMSEKERDIESSDFKGLFDDEFDAQECFLALKDFMENNYNTSLESRFLYDPSELIRQNIQGLIFEFLDDINTELSQLSLNSETELFEAQLKECEDSSRLKFVEFLYLLCTNERIPDSKRNEVKAYLNNEDSPSLLHPNLEKSYTVLNGKELDHMDKNFKLRTEDLKRLTENLHLVLAAKIKEFTQLDNGADMNLNDDEDYDEEELDFDFTPEANRELEKFVANYIYAKTNSKVQKN